ncbi:MAG: phospho-N-acetylmuramoyl-pentapeptide-transferase [Kosmotoga sp.]|nr:MAG: phospho-N-acetylmuramoyl-pentapeptide-transferase [Kosmotoga sp.]
MERVVLIASFIVALVLFKPFIEIQRKKKIGQFIREEGPDLHNYKTGTPTSGGLVFILVGLTLTLIWNFNIEYIIIFVSGVLFSITGFLDDYLKYKKKNAAGLSALTKLCIQFVSASIVILLIYLNFPHTEIIIPFIGTVDLGLLYFPLSIIIVVGTSNAVNLTDGVDGLAASVFVASVIPLLIVGYYNVLFLSLIGAVLGFIWYNWHPARIFMGDTGSLALGGILATALAIKGLDLFIIFFGSVFIAEMLSVIIQVFSYKSFGKRVFKMSPVHHHFEIIGWSETRITVIFSVVALLFSFVGLFVWGRL